MQQRLKDIGNWLQVNGEAIYKSRKREVSNQMNGEHKLYFTTKAGFLFCLFDQWSSEVTIDLLDSETVKDISLLGWDEEIQWKTEGEKLKIELPKMGLDEIPCYYAWTLKLEIE